jgi:hypothetical protein
MNRSLLSLFAACALTITSSAQGQTPPSPAPRMIAPVPQPATAIPGLRLAWSITPGRAHFDSRYAPAALSSAAAIGPNGFPAPNVPVNLVLRLHNDTASTIDVGDEGWQLTLTGSGAVSIANHSSCLVTMNIRPTRVVHVPAHGDAEIALEGLTSGGTCPLSAWFYTAPGHYSVEGTVRARYIVGDGPNIARGVAAVLAIPRLWFDVTN